MMNGMDYEVFKLKRLAKQNENEQSKLTDANFTDSRLTTMHVINISKNKQDP